MPSPLTRIELEQLTRTHWQPKRAAEIAYIDNLLPHEMKFAEADSKQAITPYDTLAMLVGFSPEPLFQSIWKYRPQRIVLLFNDHYGAETGAEMESRFLGWVAHLLDSAAFRATQPPNWPLVAKPIRGQDTAVRDARASSGWVFQTLTRLLLPDQQQGRRIVVDITGAKKTMTAGAFLFAAYAGIAISYVDFDDYDQTTRRPWGFTCRIAEQPNPYDELGLRDWERVRKLYEQYAFRRAATEVVKLKEAMCDRGYISTTQAASLDRLRSLLYVLEEWDNGDYTVAYEQWQQILQSAIGSALQQKLSQITVPQAITALGSRPWPSKKTTRADDLLQQHRDLKRGSPQPIDSIFYHPEWFLIYVADELEKIGRLIDYNNDYRSALLRAAAINELLLKARVAIMWFAKNLDGDCSLPAHDYLDTPFKNMVKQATANDMCQLLLKPGAAHWQMEKYWASVAELNHDTLLNLRNEAIHTHLAIPEELARAASTIADKALCDYQANWVGLLGKDEVSYHSWQLNWSKLCAACGVDFLPHLP